MKGAFPKGRRPRELKKTKQTLRRPAVTATIAERYFEVLQLRQRVLEADTWRLSVSAQSRATISTTREPT